MQTIPDLIALHNAVAELANRDTSSGHTEAEKAALADNLAAMLAEYNAARTAFGISPITIGSGERKGKE